MNDVLSIINGRRLQAQGDEEDLLTPVAAKHPASQQNHTSRASITTPHDALRVLRSQPDQDNLVRALKWLDGNDGINHGLNMSAPGPLQAQVLNSLLTRTMLDFWQILPHNDRELIVLMFRSVSGVCAIFSYIKQLLSSTVRPNPSLARTPVVDVLELAQYTIRGDDHISAVLSGLHLAVDDGVSRDLAWKEYSNLIGSGKIISLSAEALNTADISITAVDVQWLASGNAYSSWLGRNLAELAKADKGKYSGVLLGRSLNIGYSSGLLLAIVLAFIENHEQGLQQLEAIWTRLLLDHVGKWLSDLTRSHSKLTLGTHSGVQEVPAITAIFSSLLDANEAYAPLMSALLSDTTVAGWMSLPVRQACATCIVLVQPGEAEKLLDRLISLVGDKLFIQHATTTQQDGLIASTILVAAALQKASPTHLKLATRSSRYMTGISNRLDASGRRARWLGMILGMAISSIVDDDRMAMKFESADMHTEEAKSFLQLASLKCHRGQLRDMRSFLKSSTSREVSRQPQASIQSGQGLASGATSIEGKPVFGPPRPPHPGVERYAGSKRVTEVFDDCDAEVMEDREFQSYPKPEDDQEDSDEDASLIERNKARPPVYVRDLMTMLRDREKHDRFQMGIQHAAKLIRRKSTFGREIQDHAEELARILCNLQDPFNTTSFEELRLQALVATIMSDVKSMGPWFAKQSFVGGYSMSQRICVLVALGIAGRELAGLKESDKPGNLSLESGSFPSKQLPQRLHDVYAHTSSTQRTVEDASKAVMSQMIQPLALEAADHNTAHLNAVKLRTFSKQRSLAQSKQQTSSTHNLLAKEFDAYFFQPLVIRYQQDVAAYGMNSLYKTTPVLLSTYLKTLALLLHAAGPSTPELSQITTELWEMLLSLRAQASYDISVLDALLFTLLALLEVNYDQRRLAEENPQRIAETKEWVGAIFDRTGAGTLIKDDGSSEEARIRTLAAGVLVKLGEITEAYHKLLLGTSLDY
ncbi:hypothetical protein K431DRAFT_323892 [Polychaeton citri CBS 116435]|uniref:Telomere length regulation protein conserved domain-containing protein n=1 Tax=Polychaeton citri CBS 116435 TaxID=1314669 RepID=A0A9P4Q0N4_9PEZI|nr:hypothetical protein K431DRAFT_323892 [Polychaeton citri CBS 116435]